MKYAAVIAAAGLSSRMHEFKPMVCLGEETMIETVIGNLRSAGAAEIVVVAGYKADILRRHLEPLDITVCENKDYATTKMFDSLCLGIQALQKPYDALFVTPGDVPLVQRETIEKMLDSGAGIARPVFHGELGHPVLIRAEHVPGILAHTGDRGLLGAIEALSDVVCDIQVDDAGVTMDADTPQDVRALRRHGNALRSGGRLWPDVRIHIAKSDAILTPETAQFIEMIAHTGSIQSACACMHMSYSSGWRKLNEIEKELGYPLVTRMPGGVSGGGSELTDRGRKLLSAYQEYTRQVRALSAELFEVLFTDELHG